MNKHVFLLLLFPAFLSAQPVVTQSEPFKVRKVVFTEIMFTAGIMPSGQGDNLLLVYRSMGQEPLSFNVTKYYWAADVISPDLKRLSNNEPKKIKFPDGEDAETGYAVYFGGPSLVLQQHKKKEKKMHVYRCAIETDGTIGKPQHVCDYYAWKRETYSKEHRVLNADSSLLLLAHKPPEDAKGEPISYTIINKEWKQVREGKLEMPSIDAEILSGDFLWAADSSLWMPVWLREEDNEDVVRQELWVWRNLAAPPQRIDVSLSDERLITGMTLAQSPYDKFIYLGGAFANASKKARKNLFDPPAPPLDRHPEQGSFLVKLSSAGTIESKRSEMFKESTFSYWGLEPADLKKGSGIDQIAPRKIHPQPDGSVWLNLEVFFNAPPGQPNTFILGNPRGYTYFNSGPAIVVQYGLDGNLTQEMLIPKFSTSNTGSGMGHLMLINKGKLAFLYNDNDKNQNDEIKDASDLVPGQVADFYNPPNGQKNACSTIYYQDEKNKFKTQKLFNFKETKYWFHPHSVYQLSPTSYIIGCDGRSSVYGLLRVDWKE